MDSSHPHTQSSRKIILATILCGTFVASISQSMLTTALPSVIHDYGITALSGQLLTTAYNYTLGIVAAFSVFLITRFDSRRLFMSMISLFAIGCFLALCAPSYWILLLARFLQAFGTGILLPLVQVISLEASPKSQYGRALGIVGLAFGFAPVLGPTLSGVITDTWEWRVIFLILGSLALIALVVSSFVLKNREVPHTKKPVSLDKPSLALYSVGLIVLMIGITDIETYGFFDYRAVIPTSVGLALIVVFCFRQTKLAEPYLKISLFKNRTFLIGVALLMLAQVVMMSSAVQVPLFIQDILKLSPTVSGLLLFPGALCLPTLNPLTGRLYDRYGGRLIGVVGFSCMLVGTLSFVFFTETSPPWIIALMYMARMTGVSFLLMPMTAHSMSDLEKADIPYGTAIVNSFRQVAGGIGASVMITLTTLLSQGTTDSTGLNVQGFSASFGILSAILVIGLAIAIIFITPKTLVSKESELR